jgi:hypothetical protein
MMNQTTDGHVQWDKACKALDEEFQLSASELPDYLQTHPVLEASNRWAQ